MSREMIQDLGEMDITVPIGERKIKLNDDQLKAFGEEIAWEDIDYAIKIGAIALNQLGLDGMTALIAESKNVVEPEPKPLHVEDSESETLSIGMP